MHAEPPLYPLRYSPEVETPDPDERDTGEGLREQILKIAETTYRHGGHALLNAVLIVEPDLPAVLRQGMFAAEARYPVIMRFSTTPGDVAPDSVSTPRGLALKVYGVIGDRLPGAEGLTQDFVMATRPQSPNLIPLGGQAETHILCESFFSQASIRFGDYVAKIGVVPASPGLTALADQPLKPTGRPTALRDSVVEFFANHRAEWELRVQLCTDLDEMPVENAAKVWPEDKSPYVTVARVRAEPQRAWSDSRAEVGDDTLSFSPWHGLAAHRPLGSIMRRRKAVYEAAAAFQTEREPTIAPEPRSFSPLADL
jgi:hypothetical protein